MQKNKPLTLLGGMTPAQFLADYWQKKPLLIKQAMPEFKGLLSPDELAGLACEEEVQARIIQYKGSQWQVKQGPFAASYFAKLPKKDWTLLVQSVNHFLPEASALLQQFNFIPTARLDDLMVSYAPNGGGVGPHFDSYDVFLLQGQGKRLWRISEQTDLTCIENAPLRILKHFETSQSWLLEAGDMLYLPPQIAHWGIAESADGEDCMTYSIGFRAPKHQELATEFLGYLQDQFSQEKMLIAGLYQDADLTVQENAAEISTSMIKNISATLQKIQWSEETIGQFLGQYLSEPKPHIVFLPNKKMHLARFTEKLAANGFILDLKSQLLFHSAHFYLNGEHVMLTENLSQAFMLLAEQRCLLPNDLSKDLLAEATAIETFYAWYCAGYCHFI